MKKYVKPSLRGLGLLRVVTKFSVHPCDQSCPVAEARPNRRAHIPLDLGPLVGISASGCDSSSLNPFVSRDKSSLCVT